MPQAETDPSHETPLEIRVDELHAMREENTPHCLIDVREPHEHSTAHIDGAELVPLRTVPEAAKRLDPTQVIVVHCHHGPRSMQAVMYLRQNGFAHATNLAGGIHQWSLSIDSDVPVY